MPEQEFIKTVEVSDPLVQSIAALAIEGSCPQNAAFKTVNAEGLIPLYLDEESIKEVPGEWLLTPVDKEPVSNIATVESFCRLVSEMKEPRTRIYASMEHNAFVAVIDDDGAAGEKPRRRKHTVSLKLKRSESWNEWSNLLGQKMNQSYLAEFLESRQFDILEPDSATLIETIERLEFTRDFTFNSKVDRTSGGIKFAYEDVVDQKQGTMKLPKVFQVAAVPYLGVPSIAFEVNLRYRLEGSKLAFTLSVHNWETIEQDAFLACAQKIGELTGIDPIIQH